MGWDEAVADGPARCLEMIGICKSFGSVRANVDVSVAVAEGEVLALLGENGAGKSTLVNVLYGIHQPDSGGIRLWGKDVVIDSPRSAVRHGIGMVHQHFMQVPVLTSLENVILGTDPPHPPLLDVATARRKIDDLQKDYELWFDPMARVESLSVGEQQRLEILKALYRGCRLMVLDEPTGVLTPAEVEQLFRIMRKLKAEGRGLIFISHKLEEVKEISDRVTVLRDGRVEGTVPTARASASELAEMMVGRPVVFERQDQPVRGRDPALVVEDLAALNDRGALALRGLSLVVRHGEIVGIAGVDGNGQSELAECIAGLRRPVSGTVTLSGRAVREVQCDPAVLGYVPEDRHRTGLVLDFTVRENLALKMIDRPPVSARGLIRWRVVDEMARDLMDRYDIVASGPNAKARQLSGGNQQRVVLARETSGDPDVILASQATRGLDVGAVEAVMSLLRAQRDRGAAVLFISTELNEVLMLCDRILVMHKGEIMGEAVPGRESATEIGAMMMGQRAEGVSPSTGEDSPDGISSCEP